MSEATIHRKIEMQIENYGIHVDNFNSCCYFNTSGPFTLILHTNNFREYSLSSDFFLFVEKKGRNMSRSFFLFLFTTYIDNINAKFWKIDKIFINLVHQSQHKKFFVLIILNTLHNSV